MRLGLGLGLWRRLREPIIPDVSYWETRVIANGGTVSAGTKAAVQTFINSVNAAGLWPSILRLNLFCGDNLAACLTPLKIGTGAPTDINTNFIEAHYTSAGLNTGSGGRYLNTGLILTHPLCVGGFSIHGRGSFTSTSVYVMGATTTVPATSARFNKTGVGSRQESVWGSTDPTAVPEASISFVGLWRATRKSATINQIRKNNVDLATAVGENTLPAPALPIFVFSRNLNGSPSGTIVSGLPWGGYAIDDGGIPDAQEGAWNNAWVAFQTAVRS
jgi:hypothetical protein